MSFGRDSSIPDGTGLEFGETMRRSVVGENFEHLQLGLLRVERGSTCKHHSLSM